MSDWGFDIRIDPGALLRSAGLKQESLRLGKSVRFLPVDAKLARMYERRLRGYADRGYRMGTNIFFETWAHGQQGDPGKRPDFRCLKGTLGPRVEAGRSL